MSDRTPIVGGNWKMHTSRPEARTLLAALRAELDGIDGVEVVICPPAPWLADAADALDGSSLAIAYNTRITVTDLPDGSGVPAARRFRQDTGTVWVKVAELEGGETFEIETPVATAVAYGTEFGLELRRVASPDAGEGNEAVPNEELESVLTVSSGHVRF